jgi:hypothetical protein
MLNRGKVIHDKISYRVFFFILIRLTDTVF